ncbi:MAG: glutamate--tRNA ligase [Bacteroidales bacterium]|nr:glutamate--tRNA ligase [Bacteroidales bacterium]MCB9000072.1 glutamate--tRNA ligase [Bacteroidales bacterium]MCB9012721.1 glutamate--tRNA ligase [Bacteroidales bacterium]
MPTRPVRVRFAPSPTGPLHIGGLRTALFNYLLARKNKGTFILRIEDTDQNRYVPGAEEYIIESLKWAGIVPDEGVSFGGDYGPYRQSDRKSIYKKYADQLVESGNAYYCFDTPEELDKLRKDYESRKETFVYGSAVREGLNNSLSMSREELDQKLSSGTAYVVRFRFDPAEEIIMNDLIRGEVKVQASTLDDKVLFKSDGMPTYHLANVTDDYLMKISHVIRGEEWLPSLPLHVALYKAFGWEESMPQFAHLPLILKPDGKGKLSKRDGDKGGFPVFPLEWKDPESGDISSGYREAGYFPEACVNILAFLGWNPGSEQELFSLAELSEAFSLEKVGKSGSKFDPDKARWYNHQYLQMKPDAELVKPLSDILSKKGITALSSRNMEKIISLVKERSDFVNDLWTQSEFFFIRPEQYDPEVVKKRWNNQVYLQLKETLVFLEEQADFTSSILEPSLKSFIEKKEFSPGPLMNALRLCLVGASKGPGIFDIAEILGKDEVLLRIENALHKLKIA